jgi:hypothetical protein
MLANDVHPLRLIDRSVLLSPTMRRMTRREQAVYATDVASRRAVMRVMRRVKELRARLSGARFTCNALNGHSTYNICVNADSERVLQL